MRTPTPYAHALRARRREASTGVALLVNRGLFLVAETSVADPGGIAMLSGSVAVPYYASVCVLLWLARAASGRGTTMLPEAVRTLRDRLRLLTARDDMAGLDSELAVVQGKIERTGRGDPARPGRLRVRLETAAAAVAGPAATAAVVQVIAQLAEQRQRSGRNGG
ncbi:hypothetical protein [Streptomyces sp. 142MFCol3.1]|uniref:hypothetical protein n=1 Tax=Streptomyces sp. 142MFCol3.1 TaxID=1172179 RepID=UPI00048D9CD1|nr:hypothetical protein [Streptomyces sp. 142MFCol3.1]